MLSTVMAAVVQVSMVGAQPMSYSDAYKLNEETGKPLVVLIGADWCPACQVMKRTTMPQVAKDGVLGDVAFATLDADRDGQVATQMMKGGPIPQLLMFRKTADGWKQERLIGAQSPAKVVAFLRRGIQAAAERLGE